jgi:hypothetical protein
MVGKKTTLYFGPEKSSTTIHSSQTKQVKVLMRSDLSSIEYPTGPQSRMFLTGEHVYQKLVH